MGRTSSAGTIICRIHSQRTVESTHATLQVVAVSTGQTLGFDVITGETGAITGFTRPLCCLKETSKEKQNKNNPNTVGRKQKRSEARRRSCHHCIAPCLFHRLSNCLLWAIGPAPALVEKKFIGAFGTADAVITGVHTGLTAGRAVLTQLSGRVRI